MWFWRNRLRDAIARGLASGKLDDEIEDLGELKIKTRADAEAIHWGLSQLKTGAAGLAENTRILAGLFQNLSDGACPAAAFLRENGIADLLRLFDVLESEAATKERIPDTLLFLLKIMAMYGTTEGALKIIEAAQRPLASDQYMWSVIMAYFGADHPETQLVFKSLADPLPPDFIGMSLLDAANRVRLDNAEITHPFDSDGGVRRIRGWLTVRDPGESSYAHSATAALPFLNHPERDELLELAMRHAHGPVRLEAAWAAAKLGQERGYKLLADYCSHFNHAAVAQRYLAELGREDRIPADARTPDNRALAEFAEWLAHPNELGKPPDELEIVDRRPIAWPPERELKPFWLIRFKLRDRTGLEEDQEDCGVVGSMTFCFFSYRFIERPPEDCYAIHCYWELSDSSIQETDVEEESTEYANLLNQWKGAVLRDAKVKYVAEMSPELNYPQRLVGLASAILNGEPGYIVLDGERSAWYAHADMPDAGESLPLKLHIGRQLLGFSGAPDRKRYLRPAGKPKPDAEIIAAYERLLSNAKKLEGKARARAFGDFEPLGHHFDSYVDALGRAGRMQDIRSLVELVAPYRAGYLGYSNLGNAAHRWGLFDLAEELFVKLRMDSPDIWNDDMSRLAELWAARGELEQAKALLIDSMRAVVRKTREEDSDLEHLERMLQCHRSTFKKLFPPDAETTLVRLGIPTSVLATSA